MKLLNSIFSLIVLTFLCSCSDDDSNINPDDTESGIEILGIKKVKFDDVAYNVNQSGELTANDQKLRFRALSQENNQLIVTYQCKISSEESLNIEVVSDFEDIEVVTSKDNDSQDLVYRTVITRNGYSAKITYVFICNEEVSNEFSDLGIDKVSIGDTDYTLTEGIYLVTGDDENIFNPSSKIEDNDGSKVANLTYSYVSQTEELPEVSVHSTFDDVQININKEENTNSNVYEIKITREGYDVELNYTFNITKPQTNGDFSVLGLTGIKINGVTFGLSDDCQVNGTNLALDISNVNTMSLSSCRNFNYQTVKLTYIYNLTITDHPKVEILSSEEGIKKELYQGIVNKKYYEIHLFKEDCDVKVIYAIRFM